MKRAFLFPGQGSQYVGMGKDLAANYAEAREVFQRIDESLKQNLSGLMFEGLEADLNLTENTQPAIMAVSMAVIHILKSQGGLRIENLCSFVAGHSLGEYVALTATGALELEDTARLLRLRGRSMQKAVPVGQGSMAAILGLDFADVKAVTVQAAGALVCQIANDNSDGQVVISGHKAAVEAAAALATERGAKRAVMLPVSAPFHCSLMAPAAQIMAQALADTNIRKPSVPVVCNITARAEDDPGVLRRLLVDQITGMVRWRESVMWMKTQGVTEAVEIGAGKVLAGLVKRIEKEIVCESVGTPEGIQALIQKLKG